MKFSTTLLAVRDMDKSLEFYKNIFNQEVACDLGWNKTLSCGLCLQLNFDKLVEFPKENMKFKAYNMELYFETEDMDAFISLLEAHPGVEILHGVKTYPWHQRVIRIFDPDGHMIEVGESMESVSCGFFKKGFSVEETAKEVQHPLVIVQGWYENYLNKQ